MKPKGRAKATKSKAKPRAKAKTANGKPQAGKNPTNGRFLPGNRFWLERSSHGPKPKFATPEELWSACLEYFEWADSHPLQEEKLFHSQGKVVRETAHKMRAMTIDGMLLFIDVSTSAWHEWRTSRPDLVEVMEKAEKVIRSQKFAGAAADLLNPNIIARDLGLTDKIDAKMRLSLEDIVGGE